MTLISSVTSGQTLCPSCGHALVSERGAAPWCGACEWNLDCYEPDRRRRETAYKWLDRAFFRLAYRQNARQFRAVSAAGARKPGFSWANACVLLFSLLMLALVVAIGAAGVYITWVTFFDFRTGVGITLILTAIFLRPRFGRLDKHAYRVTRDEAPSLFDLIDGVAKAVGTKPPHAVLLTNNFNAYTSSYGLLRRRVFAIGLPLWASLAPQERVALLGHELAHFVNGDVQRGPLTSLAFTTLENLSLLTVPSRTRFVGRGGAALGELIGRLVLGVVHELLTLVDMIVTVLALRSTQRAEYYADSVAATTAGTAAAAKLMDTLAVDDAIRTVLSSSRLRREDTAQRRATVENAKSSLAPRMPGLRQLSIRDDASLFRTHPPAGLRARMLESRPVVGAAVVLSSATSSRIDEELERPYRVVMS